ncbi:MAG: tyrosine-type recombinase/integrase [Pseudomonadota bacterium]
MPAAGLHRLTDKKIKSLKGAFRLADGGGLYIKGTPTNSKSWLFSKMISGKRITKGLGPYPDVSLASARRKAEKIREVLAVGGSISEALCEERQVPTFSEFAEEWISQNKPDNGTKTAGQWRGTLRDHANPINSKRIDEIELSDVLACLTPIWITKHETARRVQQRIFKILGAARVKGLRTGDNPAQWSGNLELLLPARPVPVQHHRALHYDQIAAHYQQLCRQRSLGSLALRFLILTAARSSEARGARWSEIDLDKAIWIIPADRMKAKREHRVPLSRQAVAVLKTARQIAIRQNDFVFPSPSKHGFVTEAAIRKAMASTIAKPFTIHGFRTTFRTWATDNSKSEFDIIEDALAHQVGSSVVRAYRRSDALEKRRGLMNEWRDFLLAL